MTEPTGFDSELGTPLGSGEGPDLGAVRRRVRRRRGRRAGGILLAVALFGGVAVQTSGDRLVPRGAPPVGEIVLEAAAESPGGLRALSTGAEVAPDERVLFRLSTSAPGWTELREVLPGGLSIRLWGDSSPTATSAPLSEGARLLSYRPDGPPGARSYVALLCEDATASRCVSDTLELSWSP